MSVRATEYLYKTPANAVVTQNDDGKNTLWKKPGDDISDADVDTYGLAPISAIEPTNVQVIGVHVKHSTATGKAKLVLPPRSLLLDVYVICTEAPAGTTRPDVDFGEKDAAATDGLVDGLGGAGICDSPTAAIDLGADFKGRGALITSTTNEGDDRTKVVRYFPSGATFQNTRNSAGAGSPAGEWTIYLLYIPLPEA